MDKKGVSPRGKKIYEQIVDRLKELITAGELTAGDRLPPERKLAELFQVSRNSVREAIKTLEEKGIVASRPGAGTYVAETGGEEIIAAMAGAIEKGRHRLREVFELRHLLEPQIASLAAGRITEEEIHRLRSIVALQKEALVRGENQADLDDRFHLAIVRASGNSILAGVFGNIRDILGESRSSFLQSRKRSEKSIETHMEIVEALNRGDAALAAEKMHSHLLAVEESLSISFEVSEEEKRKKIEDDESNDPCGSGRDPAKNRCDRKKINFVSRR